MLNRYSGLVAMGLHPGQRRFHFSHEDGRTAALIARKDGRFTITGVGENRKFQSVKAATAFLHNKGYGLMSSRLEGLLHREGLHPDQHEPPEPVEPGGLLLNLLCA